jgi:hypothetical protein
MVRQRLKNYFWRIPLAAIFWVGLASPVFALFQQTVQDLERAEDIVKSHLDRDPTLRRRMLPTLWSPPQHHWLESRDDFAAESLTLWKRLFPEPNDVIQCVDCDRWRIKIEKGQGLRLHNGELSLAELGTLKQDPRYSAAKSLTMVRETPAGVEIRVMELVDGRILLAETVDATETLADLRPKGAWGWERDRRLRGEGLNYVFFNLGLYPSPVVQLEFLEQWGERNQHISGVGLSLIGPTLALGGIYHYMIPQMRRLNLSGALYLPLANAVANTGDREGLASRLVFQAMAQYAVGESYGLFASLSTEPVFSVGFVFFGPVLLPFLL